MKERGMLYSEPMVVALLDGTKSQTRRAMKHQPHEYWLPAGYGELHGFDKDGELSPDVVIGWGAFNEDGDQGYKCPYGQPGDRLWVRETFLAYGRWETRFSVKKSRDEWHFVDMTLECDRLYHYAADNPDVPLAKGRGGALPGWYTRPAIFMPRAASRILLEIVSVRVERLQEIREADAIAEGIERNWVGDLAVGPNGFGGHGWIPDCGWRHYLNSIDGDPAYTPVESYRSLWESINGVGGWDANPWVWCIKFQRVAP